MGKARRRNVAFAYSLVLTVLAAVLSLVEAVVAHLARKRARIAQSAAERANAGKTEFLTNTSHEIRTPLNGIIGLTNLLLAEPLSEASRPDLEIVRDSACLLHALVNDVLDLAKIEAGQMALEPVHFLLRPRLASVIDLFTAQARAKGLTLAWSCSERIPEAVQADAIRLQQILGNFVANAVKFTEHGSVELSAELVARDSTGIRVRFSVKDSGIGISEEVQGRLFSKFVQADASTSRKYGGTGLGLAISHSMAKVMGGTVGVESELGRGSAFWVELPLTVEGSQAASPRAPAAAAVALIGRPRVLVAEDNEVNRRVALRMLEKLGCEVDIAVNGSEAIERWESSAYDLLLMDCQMPGVDGYEAAAAIRQKEAGCARIPIVAVTAHAFSADEQRCYEAGMDGYIRKPIAAAELAAVVEKYAAREPQPACR